MDQFFPERMAVVAFSWKIQFGGDAGADGGWGTFVEVGPLEQGRGHTLGGGGENYLGVST